MGLYAHSQVPHLSATLCYANREQQGLLNADMGITAIKPVVVVCLLGQLQLTVGCISTVAGCLFETTVRKTEALGIDTRKPLEEIGGICTYGPVPALICAPVSTSPWVTW